MEEGQESRFVCKLCDKKFPCGKSLGGHMRSHVVANSAESEDRVESNLKRISCAGQQSVVKDSALQEFVNGQSGYGLRENPKKTWRAVDSRLPSSQERVCKQCGKGFQSLKALCGHMACHSERDRGLKDDHSWTSENQKLVLESHSDTEAEERRLRTRSWKSKWNKKVVEESPFSLANNGSSSVSEIDGQEQEEVALCLMLLSMDSGIKGGVNSVVESSDNNSVVLETKSSSNEMRIGKEENQNVIHNQDEMNKVGHRKLKDSILDADIAQTENSDSGYFLDECAKAESDVSVDGFRRYSTFPESKNPLTNVEWRGEEDSTAEVRKSLKLICRNQLSKLSKESEYDEDGMGSNFAGIESRKRKYSSVANPESWNESRRTMENAQDAELCKSYPKKSKYECFNCKKIFKSYQALGGHRPCHKRSNAFYESRYESGENSLDDATNYRTTGKVVESSNNRKSSAKNSSREKNIKPKNNKGHVCPFCNKVFKNGQALGGHKRSHFIGGHEENSTRSPVVKPELPDLLDLNLPAPEVGEDDEQSQFFSQ